MSNAHKPGLELHCKVRPGRPIKFWFTKIEGGEPDVMMFAPKVLSQLGSEIGSGFKLGELEAGEWLGYDYDAMKNLYRVTKMPKGSSWTVEPQTADEEVVLHEIVHVPTGEVAAMKVGDEPNWHKTGVIDPNAPKKLAGEEGKGTLNLSDRKDGAYLTGLYPNVNFAQRADDSEAGRWFNEFKGEKRIEVCGVSGFQCVVKTDDVEFSGNGSTIDEAIRLAQNAATETIMRPREADCDIVPIGGEHGLCLDVAPDGAVDLKTDFSSIDLRVVLRRPAGTSRESINLMVRQVVEHLKQLYGCEDVTVQSIVRGQPFTAFQAIRQENQKAPWIV